MRNKLIIGIVVAQVIVILAIFVPQQYKVLTAQHTVRLQTIPVDPTDLMRGHYAEVEYKISSIEESQFAYPIQQKLKKGDIVYVPLVKRGNIYVISENFEVMNRPPLGKIFIKGTIDQFKPRESDEDYWEDNYAKVKYGIEKIFISEAKAKKMEWLNKPYIVTARIGSDGEAKALSIDSEPKTKKD